MAAGEIDRRCSLNSMSPCTQYTAPATRKLKTSISSSQFLMHDIGGKGEEIEADVVAVLRVALSIRHLIDESQEHAPVADLPGGNQDPEDDGNPRDQQTPRKTLAHEPQQLGQCLNPAGYLLKVDAMHMPPSPGEPVGQGSVHPEKDGGPRENGEEEGRLAAKDRPEDIQIPDGREPGPIDQEATRHAQYDEAGQDDDNSDCDASSWHIHLPRLFVMFTPSDRVAFGGSLRAERRRGQPAPPVVNLGPNVSPGHPQLPQSAM